jgi:hypothetical protein
MFSQAAAYLKYEFNDALSAVESLALKFIFKRFFLRVIEALDLLLGGFNVSGFKAENKALAILAFLSFNSILAEAFKISFRPFLI